MQITDTNSPEVQISTEYFTAFNRNTSVQDLTARNAGKYQLETPVSGDVLALCRGSQNPMQAHDVISDRLTALMAS